MVTTNCFELTGSGNCTLPLSGNSFEELKNNIFKHGQQHHAEMVKALSPQDQAGMVQRIQQVWSQKSAPSAATKR